MRLFLAGIMQGSHVGLTLHSQDYRDQLKRLIAEHVPGADVYDPLADHRDSLNYDDLQARGVFLHHNAMCCDVDGVIAFIPQASMGTAIEIWEAHRHGRAVIAISPLVHNWAVKFLSDRVYADVESFEQALRDGEVLHILRSKLDSTNGGCCVPTDSH